MPKSVADTGNSRIRLLTTALRTISSIAPEFANVGTSGFTMEVSGSGFVNGDTVQWNGTALLTTFVNAGLLKAQVTSAQIARPGTALVTVNGLSNVVTFAIAALP